MNILYIDTHSTKNFNIGYFNGEIFVEKNGKDASCEMIDSINELTKNNIDKIIINKGPGSLTGLRIGSSFAQGIALYKNIQVLGISIWDILLLEYPDTDIFFFTGTKKWIKKNSTEEIIFEDDFCLSNNKWISNKPDLVPLDKTNNIEYSFSVSLMHKYQHIASKDINILYPINMF
ncbi:hypothetical protein [Alphaproteobacteria bacterium endosymbiont of Tiliacea citrago]|uniref:hypothetical protein n=1 Tax=Alphaproteobacteria bacterium endosymbiont of Tiliacea citrago TaxID=3077944 RepID=UPI00313DAA14